MDAWDCTKHGDFVLILNEPIPCGFFKKCRIDSKEYQLVPVHLFGVAPEVLLKHIGIKAVVGEDFIGKTVEFVEENQK